MKKVISNQNEICNMQFSGYKLLEKFRQHCKKTQCRSGYFCNTYITYICSLLQNIGNGSMYKDWDSNKRKWHWDETLLTYDFRCSFFLKTGGCLVLSRYKYREHTYEHTKSWWRLLGMKWWHCGCRSTCVAQPLWQGSSQHRVLPHLVERRIITIDIACFQCDKRSLGGEDICPK